MGTGFNCISKTAPSDLSREDPRLDAYALKACIDSLQRRLGNVEALAAGYRAEFEMIECGEITGGFEKP